MSERADGEAGFTLLETLVAFAIIALALGAAYGVFGSGARATRRAEIALEALTRAEATMARVGPEIALAPGETVLREEGWTVTVAIAPHRPEVAYAWAPLGLRPLIVRVEAVAPAGRTARLETLRLGAVK